MAFDTSNDNILIISIILLFLFSAKKVRIPYFCPMRILRMFIYYVRVFIYLMYFIYILYLSFYAFFALKNTFRSSSAPCLYLHIFIYYVCVFIYGNYFIFILYLYFFACFLSQKYISKQEVLPHASDPTQFPASVYSFQGLAWSGYLVGIVE